MLLLKNCHLIDGLTEGYTGDTADVLISGEKIEKIADCGSIPADAGVTVIDLCGKTLMPGLFDLHAHVNFADQDYTAALLRSECDGLILALKHTRDYLRSGYTTIRDCGGNSYYGPIVRDAVNKGFVEGPRILSAGKILTPTTIGNENFAKMYVEIDKCEDFLAACRVELKNHADFIKYMATGAMMNEGGDPGAMICTPQELKAIVDAADSLGTYVVAHCHGTEGIKQSLLNGVRTIEHATYIDDECINIILDRGNYQSIVPTYTITYTMAHALMDPNILPERRKKAQDALDVIHTNHKSAHEKGVKVGWGTDMDNICLLQHPGIEFTARKAMGLPNIEILKQATIISAEIIGWENEVGSIKVGKYADLIVIDGRPEDNLDVMTKVPEMVFKGGALVR